MEFREMTADELTQALEDIQTQLAGILDQLNGSEDDASEAEENLDELEQKSTELLEEKRAIESEIEARKATAKQRKDIADAIARGNIGTVIAKAPKTEGKMTLDEVRGSHEYNVAYADYITGRDKDEVRALLTDMVTGGTVPVPTMVSDAIATAWEKAEIVSRINKIQVNGSYTAVFELSATGASVHVEGSAAPAEETIKFGQVKIEPEYLKKWITVSDKVLSLKGEQFLSYLNQEITYRIQKLADDQLVAAIKAAPAASSATAAGVPEVKVTAIDPATIFAAEAKLADEAVNPVAIMTKNTYFNKIMALVDTTKRPIYDIVSANGQPQYYVNGVEVLFNSSVGDDTILVGDLNGALAVVPNGETVEFVTDPYSLAEKNLVKIVGKELIGLAVVKPGYFAKVTIGA